MILSHTHKFIFIKPQKTAGTSVELLLSRICGDEDVITPLGFDPDPNVREKHRAREPQNYFRPKPLKNWELRELYWFIRKGVRPNLNYWEHLRAGKIKEYAGEKVWNTYLKISIVRNPWDHAVSMYEWMATYGFGKVVKGDFDDFVRYKYMEMWPFFAPQGNYEIDVMLRFESLAPDLENLSTYFSELKGLSLPVTKNATRTSRDYTTWYNNKTREVIREKNLNIIDRFGYDF